MAYGLRLYDSLENIRLDITDETVKVVKRFNGTGSITLGAAHGVPSDADDANGNYGILDAQGYTVIKGPNDHGIEIGTGASAGTIEVSGYDPGDPYNFFLVRIADSP